MKNTYSIDELVREKLAEGQEAHNLGAWANMERMLDGKNPYKKPDDTGNKKKWLLMLLLLLGTAVTSIGAYVYSNIPKKNASAIASNTTLQSTPNSTSQESLETPSSIDPPQELDQLPTINQLSANSNNIVVDGSNNNSNNGFVNNVDNESNIAPVAKKSGNLKKANQHLVASTNSNEQTISKTTEDQVIPSENKNVETNQVILPNQNEKRNETQAQKVVAKKSNRTNKAQTETLEETLKQNEASQNLVSKNATTSEENSTLTASNEQRFREEDAKLMYKTEVLTKDANGQIISRFDSVEKNIKIKVPIEQSNPRYVKLDEESLKKAELKTPSKTADKNIQASSQKEPATASLQALNNSLKKQDSEIISPSSAIKQDNLASTEKEKGSFYNRFKALYKPFLEKMNKAAIQIGDKQIPIYPGMIMGVNASLFNTQHNFAGFQGGLTALTPLNRFLSLSMEARLQHRNNSGYTVNDYNYSIKNSVIDGSSLPNSNIYIYQIDSNALVYNFKNFYTLQLPILLNAHVKDFTFYGGVNMEYGFRMDVKTSDKSYVVNASDTIPTGTMYTQRIDISKKYTASDFSSRFGLGYTIGTSYSFNPNLYLDFRLSNVLWDNSKSTNKAEISDNFFKIPALQFSLGYRFRKFERED